MSHASSFKIQKYDAFLSFRGVDIRKTFVSHLYNALVQRGINVFKDDERLETGKSISDELLKAIEESKFAIVIFSESYASSKWCLNELAHIIKCRKELDLTLIPIFFDVNPSDVSHQTQSFAESFSKHEEQYKDDMEKIQRWRDAFAVSGEIKGHHLQNYQDEADCIKKVVDELMISLHIKSDDEDDDDAGDRGIDSKSTILIEGGKMSFSRVKKTGKKCFMIAARGLDIEWSNTPDYWEWLPHSESRFGEVAKLKWVCWLDIRGKIETQRLSKRTKYVAYLVFKLEDKFHGLETVKAVVRLVDYMSVKEAEQRASVVHFSGRGAKETLPVKRGDGWMELKMGDFFNQDPDKAWYTDIETCLTSLPEVSSEEKVAGGQLEKWPKRLHAIPPRISRGTVNGVTSDTFNEDSQLWKRRVWYYKTVNNQLGQPGRYRNLLDMNAYLGGFAANLVDDPVWVMNIVPAEAKVNTLGVIYERGLIGTYQSWCEAMSTYPRTYDLIHADSVFTLYKDRCEMEDILLEMDRILRPEGSVIIRDDVDTLIKVKRITDGLNWDSQIVDHEDGPLEREKLLFAVKSYWTAPSIQES